MGGKIVGAVTNDKLNAFYSETINWRWKSSVTAKGNYCA